MYSLEIALEQLDLALEELNPSHILSDDSVAMEGIGTAIRSFSEKIKTAFQTKKPTPESKESVKEDKLRSRRVSPDKIDSYIYNKKEEWVHTLIQFYSEAYKRINQFELIPLTVSFSTITDQNDNDPSVANPVAFRKFDWMFYISAVTKEGKHVYIPLSDQSQLYNSADAQKKREYDQKYKEISYSMLDVIAALNMIDEDDPLRSKSEFAPQFNRNASGITVTATILHEKTQNGVSCRLYSSQFDLLRRFTYAQLASEAYYLDDQMYNESLNMNKKYISQMFGK